VHDRATGALSVADLRWRGMRVRMFRCAAAVTALLLAPALAGCGLGAGNSPQRVALVVTRDFGASTIGDWSAPRVSGEDTVMSLLVRNASVGTSDGGGFVQSIDGHAAGQQGSEPVGWFYFVNGVQSAKGAAATDVRSGDRVWWDLHDWSQSEESPAVVGSFPAPFTTGLEGKRLAVRVECALPSSSACLEVAARLRTLGVRASVGAIDRGEVPSTLRVLVGAWAAIRDAGHVSTLEEGPRASGVYARFSAGGATLDALDDRGRTVAALGAGAGLVAATRHGEDAPVWVVSGTDEAGVHRAAGAFDVEDLRDRFALTLDPAGAKVAVPAVPAAGSPVAGSRPAESPVAGSHPAGSRGAGA
jgi:hypothetical protein